MRICFRCLLCEPHLIPTKRQKFRTFGPNRDALEIRLDEEFQTMVTTIRERIREEEEERARLEAAAVVVDDTVEGRAPREADDDYEVARAASNIKSVNYLDVDDADADESVESRFGFEGSDDEFDDDEDEDADTVRNEALLRQVPE